MLTVYDEKKIDAFRAGVAHKKEVVAALGKPEWWNSDSTGDSVLGYSYREAASHGISRRLVVTFKFDGKKILYSVETAPK